METVQLECCVECVLRDVRICKCVDYVRRKPLPLCQINYMHVTKIPCVRKQENFKARAFHIFRDAKTDVILTVRLEINGQMSHNEILQKSVIPAHNSVTSAHPSAD